jgi:hypothetical protein
MLKEVSGKSFPLLDNKNHKVSFNILILPSYKEGIQLYKQSVTCVKDVKVHLLASFKPL